MRALRTSPLFRIAVFSLAVLFAHTIRANTQPIASVRPQCALKLSTAQPDSNKKLFSAIKRSASRPHPDSGTSFGGAFGLGSAQPRDPLSGDSTGHIARVADAIPAQRRGFVLRL
jgi:hypothetical protein